MKLVDKLGAIGEEIRDSHIATPLLCSLLQSYNILITALESKEGAQLTPSYIKTKLIDEYNRGNENVENS